MNKDDCIFCKIANGDVPSYTLFEDNDFRIILDIGPATKGHALLIPKEHAENLYDLPDNLASRVLVLAKKMMEKITDKLSCDGFNLVQNNGEAAGQTVRHFHVHLIPRYDKDGQKINWSESKPSKEELENIKKLISE